MLALHRIGPGDPCNRDIVVLFVKGHDLHIWRCPRFTRSQRCMNNQRQLQAAIGSSKPNRKNTKPEFSKSPKQAQRDVPPTHMVDTCGHLASVLQPPSWQLTCWPSILPKQTLHKMGPTQRTWPTKTQKQTGGDKQKIKQRKTKRKNNNSKKKTTTRGRVARKHGGKLVVSDQVV